MIDSLDTIVATLGGKGDELARAADNLGVASAGTAKVIADNRPGLDRTIAQLKTILEIVDRNRAELDDALIGLPKATHALLRATTYGKWVNLNIVCLNQICGPVSGRRRRGRRRARISAPSRRCSWRLRTATGGARSATPSGIRDEAVPRAQPDRRRTGERRRADAGDAVRVLAEPAHVPAPRALGVRPTSPTLPVWRANNEVRVAGLKVGKVKSVELAEPDGRGVTDRVRVVMEVSNGVDLGNLTEGEIKLKTILGSKFVELVPKGTEPLEGVIPLERTRIPFELYEVDEPHGRARSASWTRRR